MKQIAKTSYAFFLSTAPIIKVGKDNVTISTPGLFGCEKISFQSPFSDGQQVKVFASFGHTVKSPKHRFGAAGWVESVSTGGFTVCVLEYGEGSKGFAEVNWIALQSTPWISARNCGVGSMDYRNRVYYYHLWKGLIQAGSYFLLIQTSDKGKLSQKTWRFIARGSDAKTDMAALLVLPVLERVFIHQFLLQTYFVKIFNFFPLLFSFSFSALRLHQMF